MLSRSRRESVTFLHPAAIEGIDRPLLPGTYDVVIDEELIEGLSFPSYRRVATLIMVPGATPGAIEMVGIESAALADALSRDAETLLITSGGQSDR